jgi:hypothetical protein
MASYWGSTKLKNPNPWSIHKKWWVGKAFIDTTYTDRPNSIGNSQIYKGQINLQEPPHKLHNLRRSKLAIANKN